jgi:hypothetical protein
MVTLNRFVRDFEAVVAQSINNVNSKIGRGQCKDHPEYKQQCGIIAGMELAVGLARDMLRQVELAVEEGGGLQEMPAEARKKAGKRKRA